MIHNDSYLIYINFTNISNGICSYGEDVYQTTFMIIDPYICPNMIHSCLIYINFTNISKGTCSYGEDVYQTTFMIFDLHA